MNNYNIKIQIAKEIDETCGTKSLALYKLKNLGLAIPDFCVIPSNYFETYCQNNGVQTPENFYTTLNHNSEISKCFTKLKVLNKSDIIKKIGEGKYIVRSSAIPTKHVDLSVFPSMISGAFESYYAASISEAIDSIANVWASVYSDKAYNQCRLFSSLPIISGIGVIIQQYVEPVISGVVHTKMGRISVNWIEGHLKKIVEGKAIGNSVDIYKNSEDHYILRGIERNIIYIKTGKYEKAFKELFENAIMIKEYFGHEQEIEWLYDGEKIWIIQSQSLIV